MRFAFFSDSFVCAMTFLTVLLCIIIMNIIIPIAILVQVSELLGLHLRSALVMVDKDPAVVVGIAAPPIARTMRLRSDNWWRVTDSRLLVLEVEDHGSCKLLMFPRVVLRRMSLEEWARYDEALGGCCMPEELALQEVDERDWLCR